MLTDIQKSDIQKLIIECSSNEELQQRLRTYFLVNLEEYQTVDPTRLAWHVYKNIIQNNKIV